MYDEIGLFIFPLIFGFVAVVIAVRLSVNSKFEELFFQFKVMQKRLESTTESLNNLQEEIEKRLPQGVATNAGNHAEEQKDAMDILERMRAKIEKEEEEKAKLAAEARELGISTSEVASMDNVEEMLEAKPKTEAEKLELTRKKAMDKLDFYERVVRSVAREENEVSDYYEIMGEKKQRSTVMLGAAPEEAPAEQQQVEQNAAPTEAQVTPETKVEKAK